MVNTRSRFNHSPFDRFIPIAEVHEDSHEMIISDPDDKGNARNALHDFFIHLDQNLQEVLHDLRNKQVDIDNYDFDPGNTGIVTLQPQTRRPYKLTDIFAVWGTSVFSNAQQTVQGTAPGAGSNFTYTNLTGQPQNLLSLQALFTASATVANRFLQWQIQDASGNVIAYSINGAAVVASTSCTVDAYQGNTYLASAAGTWQSPLPSAIQVPINGKVILQTGIQAGDTWTNIVLLFSNPPSSPLVTITIGKRIFFPTPSAGSFSLLGLQSGIQVERKDPVILKVTPVSTCYFEVMGYQDYRKIDTQ